MNTTGWGWLTVGLIVVGVVYLRRERSAKVYRYYDRAMTSSERSPKERRFKGFGMDFGSKREQAVPSNEGGDRSDLYDVCTRAPQVIRG